MRHVFICYSYLSEAWFGPCQLEHRRNPVCVYQSGSLEDESFAEAMVQDALDRHQNKRGNFNVRIEEVEDHKSREEFELQERIAEAAEQRAMQPREFFYD